MVKIRYDKHLHILAFCITLNFILTYITLPGLKSGLCNWRLILTNQKASVSTGYLIWSGYLTFDKLFHIIRIDISAYACNPHTTQSSNRLIDLAGLQSLENPILFQSQ